MQMTANENAAGILAHRHLHLVDDWPVNRLLHYLLSLQNRRNFLRILGEQRRKRGERETRVVPSSHRALLALGARLVFASVCLKYTKKLRLFCWLVQSSCNIISLHEMS